MSSQETSKELGSFLQSFNEIEAQTYVILRMLPQDKLTSHAKNIDQFKNRARFVQALLKSSSLTSKEELYTLLDQAIELSGYRNKLSHNPLRVNIYQDTNGDVNVKEKILDSRKGGEVAQVIEQLLNKLAEVSNLVREFFKLTAEVTILDK